MSRSKQPRQPDCEIRSKLLRIEDIDLNGPNPLAKLRRLLHASNEDLLTADVFGALKYLPRSHYLSSVLNAIALRNPSCAAFERILPSMKERIRRLSFHFWPSYATPGELAVGRTEPDVVLSDETVFMLFEMKLWSRFGDRQLERELLVAAYEANGREFFLVLVTPGSKPPRS